MPNATIEASLEIIGCSVRHGRSRRRFGSSPAAGACKLSPKLRVHLRYRFDIRSAIPSGGTESRRGVELALGFHSGLVRPDATASLIPSEVRAPDERRRAGRTGSRVRGSQIPVRAGGGLIPASREIPRRSGHVAEGKKGFGPGRKA